MNKTAFAAEHGEDKLHRLRRGYRDQPTPLAKDDPRHPRHQEIYRDIDAALLPATESLADTLARLLPCWNGTIAPAIARGECILIVSHGNTLRALLKHLEKMTEREIEQFEIPTGHPLLVELAPNGDFLRRDYLDPLAAAESIKASE